MFIGSVALIVDFIGLVQFIGWVAPSCVYTEIVLDGIISKLQCSVFYVKKDYEQGTCLCNNLNFRQKIAFGCLFVYFLVWLF